MAPSLKVNFSSCAWPLGTSRTERAANASIAAVNRSRAFSPGKFANAASKHEQCNAGRRQDVAVRETFRHAGRPAPAVGNYATVAGNDGRTRSLPATEILSARRQHHDHLAPFEFRLLLDLGERGGVGLDALEQLHAE